MKKSSKIMILGGTGALFTSIAVMASSCGNDTEAKLDMEGSLSDVTVGVNTISAVEEVEIIDTTAATTTTKVFTTTTNDMEETTIPIEFTPAENEVDITYDTTIEAPIDAIPENFVNVSGNNNNVDVNVIVNAPSYSISAEEVEIENGDQIIYDEDMDSFNENENSYNGNHTHQNVAETTAPVTTVAPATTTKNTTTKKVVTTPVVEDPEEINPVEKTSLDNFAPAIIKLTAEDILTMSKEFAKYINENGIFSHRNYKYDKFDMTEMYSVVYLANIDYVSPEETKRLIDGKFISDDILVNVQNSFNFYSFYTTETVNRIKDGKTQILDLSKMIVDPEAKKAYKAHEAIITGFNQNKDSKNLKNYVDAVFYFAQGVTIKNRNDYDYSKSIYKTDREALSVGADYALCYMGDCIDEIAKDFGIAIEEYSQIMQLGRDDISDIVRVFESYINEKSNCYTKR